MAEVVTFRDRYDIDPGEPLPTYDSPTAKAYAAGSKGGDRNDLIALVCDPDIPVRMGAVEGLRGFPGSGLLKFQEVGVINWPLTKRRQAVAIYDRPGGTRVFSDMNATIQPMSDDRITKGFLTPVVATLREMSQRGLTHRNIRPTNIYFTDDQQRSIVLGEMITAPPGYNQPIYFESLDTGMADQTARGDGGILDDLYAVGVTILALLIGRAPLTQVEPTQHIFDRINLGSYGVVVGGNRIQMNWTELFRGLLADDPRERWGLRDVELWLGGRRLTPKQVKLPTKAARPLMVGGGSYENVRAVAHALGRNWSISGDIVRGQDFDNWLKRSLSDERAVEAVGKVAGSNAAMQLVSKGDDAKLVTRVAIGLDPSAPLRHKGLSAHIDGIGPTLAIGFRNDDTRQRVADFINGRFVTHWIGQQARTRSDIMSMYAQLEKMPGYLNQTGPGYGIERVLYELNSDIQCKSSMIEHLYVTRPDELVPALEAVAQARDVPPAPMDRHIAAFLGARSQEIDDRQLRPLAMLEERPGGDVLNVLRILARVQTASRNGAAPGLCKWIATLMKPAINAYRNLKMRKQIETSVDRAVDTGYLPELLKIFDDMKTIQRDEQGYKRAQSEHSQCSSQIAQMTLDLQNRENLASELGEQVAAVISGVIGSVGSTSIIVIYLL